MIPKAKSSSKHGSHVVWPRGLEDRYGISAPTRWRWERDGKLPKRDINVGGKTGWKPSTLDTADGTSAAVAVA
jgi:predicted DNA-binding transcriptional regulator AlpA